MISEKDAVLLRCVRKNSRKSLAKISKETGIPLSTLFEKLKKLESNIILKHVSLLDFSRLGYGVKASFVISSDDKWRLKDFLVQSRSVNSLSSLINGHDFYAECIFRDLKDMMEFKESLKQFKINDIEEILLVDELKREGFVI